MNDLILKTISFIASNRDSNIADRVELIDKVLKLTPIQKTTKSDCEFGCKGTGYHYHDPNPKEEKK